MNLYGYEFQRESDLVHHGIIGMKWGVRRYQNADGSLTAAGRKRLDKGKKIKNFDQKAYQKYSVEEDRKNKHAAYVAKVADTLTGSKNGDYSYVKSAIDNSLYEDKKLFSLVDEAARLDNELEYAAAEFSKDKDLIRKTAEAYIKEKGKEKYAEYYTKQQGIDAAAEVWAYYVRNTPELDKKSEKIYDLQTEFEKQSEQYYKKFFGDLNSKKDKYGSSLSRSMAIEAREKFMDLVWNQAEHIWRTE